MKMGSQSCFKVLIICLIAIIGAANAQLQLGFYAKSCPKAEKIVLKYVHKHIPNAPSLAAALIRLHFHDCFVRGCDASVLLNATQSNPQAEKNSFPNLTLRGFEFIDKIKSLIEAECPGVVSCADILTLSARDSIHAVGGPFWNVPTGRRDGVRSKAADVFLGLPAPFHNVSTLLTLFGNVGLDANDLVLLSGAHTIGISHCASVSNRLYNFTGKLDQDPDLDSAYAKNLKTFKCKSISDQTTVLEMDPGSRNTFDLGYYKQVVKRRGLFESDAALLKSSTTRSIVAQHLQSTKKFFVEFAKSMEKMGRINVKVGTEGEIRKHCAFVN
ncbi:peroxidase 3-like protein [Trifolium pratense]|uniref:Peroxidase n=1 Tax=Trifolium pratense TaxID=57577 RepID=A0A2K3LCR6_TRIPR|nr:peroxidase 39 [Trifolium pratense]PNX76328.1 peroxidase 3-like protein [Trifolium pratense]